MKPSAEDVDDTLPISARTGEEISPPVSATANLPVPVMFTPIRRRRRLRLWVGLIVVVLTAGGGGFYWWQHAQLQQPVGNSLG